MTLTTAQRLTKLEGLTASLDRRVTALETPSTMWGLIGNDGLHLAAERDAGINTKLFELSWDAYETANGAYSATYITAKWAELGALRRAGFQVILSLGWHFAPQWAYATPDPYYVNQYGDLYDSTEPGAGRANVIWNPQIRSWTGRYIARVFADFGTDWAGVRIGGGRYGETGYPVSSWNGKPNTYWCFDANAAESAHAIANVGTWKPGTPTITGAPTVFANWYLNRLVEYQTWQIAQVRLAYPGRIMVLYPSWGIRPGQLAAAVAGNLSGATSAEINGEVQRGYDHSRFIAALTDPKAVVTTTWLDAGTAGDKTDPWQSPVAILASLAAAKGLQRFGENTGEGSVAALQRSVAQTKAYGLLGMLWFREDQLLSGAGATLADYAAAIKS